MVARSSKKDRAAGHNCPWPPPRLLLCHQLGKLFEYIGNLPPQRFIITLEPCDFLRVYAVHVGVDGHLIEIVGTPPLKGNQLFYGREINMESCK